MQPTFHHRVLMVYLLAVTFMIPHAEADATLRVVDAWSRALPPVVKVGVAYMTLENQGSEVDRLIAASTPVAERAELHTHRYEDGLMKMRQIEFVDIAPGTTTSLAPGGLHLMLMGLKTPMTAGTSFSLTLTFEKAGEVEVEVPVKRVD